MVATITPNALDAALNYIKTNSESLYICSAQPTSYAEASSTYKLGTKATPTITGPGAGDVSGRKIILSAITDGAVSGTNTATWLALCKDSATAELLAAQELSAPQGVTSGNTFTLTAADIELPDPTA